MCTAGPERFRLCILPTTTATRETGEFSRNKSSLRLAFKRWFEYWQLRKEIGPLCQKG